MPVNNSQHFFKDLEKNITKGIVTESSNNMKRILTKTVDMKIDFNTEEITNFNNNRLLNNNSAVSFDNVKIN